MERVLVLGAYQRSALAVVRSFGAAGLYVVVADTGTETLAGSSKYASFCEKYSDPDNENKFIEDVNKLIVKHNIDVVYPVTEVTLYTLLENRASLLNVNLPFTTLERIKRLSDKSSLVRLSQSLNLLTPKSAYFSKASELTHEIAEQYQYPVVIKPNLSRVKIENTWLSASVKYAFSSKELINITRDDPVFVSHAFMVQEYIEGQGSGVFLVYNKGKYVTHFAHKRIREKPPAGGVSVLSESVTADPVQLETAKCLLSAAVWHGVAMVEFKVDKNGNPYVIEVNPRFWGSLQLAIDSGVNFPVILHEISMGRTPTIGASYKAGQKLRWMLGDLDNLYLVFRSDEYSFAQKLMAIVKFLLPWQPSMRFEINRLSDLNPFFFELKSYLRAFKD